MLDTGSSPRSALVEGAFHTMEEVTEVAHATGWQGDYHQLGKGPVTSRWRSLHLGRSSLVLHRLDNRVHVRVAPPKGCVALAIMPPPYHILVEGAEFGSNQVLVMDAEMNFVTPAVARCDTLVLPRLVFEASAQAFFPRMSSNGELAHLIQCPSSGWLALQVEFRNLLGDSNLSPEDLSRLLDRFLDLMAGETEERPGETCLGNTSTGYVTRRAQEYIEDHYRDTIRMEDLCRHVGVSLRTLQRSFSRYFQVSPLDYIKARRINAARQDLVAGDSASDSVTRIALDSGFTHLGRFSVDYREHFGESPRETLAWRENAGRRRAVAEWTDPLLGDLCKGN